MSCVYHTHVLVTDTLKCLFKDSKKFEAVDPFSADRVQSFVFGGEIGISRPIKNFTPLTKRNLGWAKIKFLAEKEKERDRNKDVCVNGGKQQTSPLLLRSWKPDLCSA